MALDATFFRKAKRANRAVELTDTEAVIPAVKDTPEIRVPLPNRRILGMDERKEKLAARTIEITKLEEEIEVERKKLMDLTKKYRDTRYGVADVVIQNQKVKEMMERRSSLSYPEVWIEEIKGLTLKDVFESKRDTRKIANNAPVYQVKRRVEPISSLYVDVGAAAVAAVTRDEDKEALATEALAAPPVKPVAPVQKTAEEIAKGSIIRRRVIKMGKKA